MAIPTQSLIAPHQCVPISPIHVSHPFSHTHVSYGLPPSRSLHAYTHDTHCLPLLFPFIFPIVSRLCLTPMFYTPGQIPASISPMMSHRSSYRLLVYAHVCHGLTPMTYTHCSLPMSPTYRSPTYVSHLFLPPTSPTHVSHLRHPPTFPMFPTHISQTFHTTGSTIPVFVCHVTRSSSQHECQRGAC